MAHERLFDNIVHADGHGTDVSEFVRTATGNDTTLHLEAWAEYGISPPPTPVAITVEVSADGVTWTTLIDFGEVDGVVERQADWTPTDQLRIVWQFEPVDSRHWWPVVRVA